MGNAHTPARATAGHAEAHAHLKACPPLFCSTPIVKVCAVQLTYM